MMAFILMHFVLFIVVIIALAIRFDDVDSKLSEIEKKIGK